MNCNVCQQHQPVLKHWGGIEVLAKGGNLKVHTICETCMGKIEDFLKALGWGLSREGSPAPPKS